MYFAGGEWNLRLPIDKRFVAQIACITKMSRSLSAREVLGRVGKLNVWRRRGERAPHKPLLMLLALGRVVRGEQRLAPFPDIEPKLARLLEEFGPPRQHVHPEYPFWRLQHDGLWEVHIPHPLRRRRSSDDPPASELRKHQAPGGFPQELDRLFREDRSLVAEVALSLLHGHFPESLHGEILAAVGLSHVMLPVPEEGLALFREAVLEAYGHACALCGYDVRLGRGDLGMGASHIEWRPAGGPDTVQNGLALCAIHQKAFDRGAVTLGADYRILVSSRIHGSVGVEEWYRALAGREARLPRDAQLAPSPAHLE